MLLEVDLSKPLIRRTKTRLEGETKWVMFKYEQLPFFYFYYGKISHGKKMCREKMQDSRNNVLVEGQFGEWLRASNGRLNNKDRHTGDIALQSSSLKDQEIRYQNKNGSAGTHKLRRVQSEDWSGRIRAGKEESQEDTGSVGSWC